MNAPRHLEIPARARKLGALLLLTAAALLPALAQAHATNAAAAGNAAANAATAATANAAAATTNVVGSTGEPPVPLHASAASSSANAAAAAPTSNAASAAATSASAAAAVAPQRLVTLGGAVTEIAFALGAEAEIIATDKTSLYPPRAQNLPSVGVYRALSAEGVLGMNPSKILSGSGIGPEAAVRQLRACGVPLVIIENPRSPETLYAAIATIGREARREKEAAALTAKIRSELEAVRAFSAGRAAPRVVFLMGQAGVASAAGSATQADGIVALAGGKNLFAKFRGYKPVSEEAVLQAAPNVILIATHTAQGSVAAPKDPAAFLRRFGFKALGSQPGVRVVPVDIGEFLIIGPRAGESALKLARILHGEETPTGKTPATAGKAAGTPTATAGKTAAESAASAAPAPGNVAGNTGEPPVPLHAASAATAVPAPVLGNLP